MRHVSTKVAGFKCDQWLGYTLNDWGKKKEPISGVGTCLSLHNIHASSEVNQASYPVSTKSSFSRNKAAEAWSLPHPSTIHLHGVMLNFTQGQLSFSY
jgi:hypothetical protein